MLAVELGDTVLLDSVPVCVDGVVEKIVLLNVAGEDSLGVWASLSVEFFGEG